MRRPAPQKPRLLGHLFPLAAPPPPADLAPPPRLPPARPAPHPQGTPCRRAPTAWTSRPTNSPRTTPHQTTACTTASTCLVGQRGARGEGCNVGAERSAGLRGASARGALTGARLRPSSRPQPRKASPTSPPSRRTSPTTPLAPTLHSTSEPRRGIARGPSALSALRAAACRRRRAAPAPPACLTRVNAAFDRAQRGRCLSRRGPPRRGWGWVCVVRAHAARPPPARIPKLMHPSLPSPPPNRWFEADLKKVDRSKTPWLIIFMHAPIVRWAGGGSGGGGAGVGLG
jgi:hypothetical protein